MQKYITFLKISFKNTFANFKLFLSTSLTIVPKQSYSLYSLNVIIIKNKKNYTLNVNWE